MRIGTIIYINGEQSIAGFEQRCRALKDMGFACLHLVWNRPELYTGLNAALIKRITEALDLPIINFTPAMGGVLLWDLAEAPATNGLLPATYRKERIENILRASEFCEWAGISTLSAHIGYLPVNRHDPDYAALVQAMKFILPKLRARGQRFLIETGQEAPILLKRALTDIDEPNLFVNFDPANIIMSGLGIPTYALDTLKGYIQGFHAKDGKIGHDMREPEVETLIGEGDADFDAVLEKLFFEQNYAGDVIIEREVPPDLRDKDLVAELAYLKKFFAAHGIAL